MNLYPAIDIMDGRAVRLRQGRREDVTVYGTPLEMARRWAQAGARWLHVVDLDAAFEGRRSNSDAIRSIRSELPEVQIQTGGGIRDMATVVRLLSQGANRVVLGTAAVEDQSFLRDVIARFPDQVAVGIDARDGVVRVGGWTRSASLTALEFANQVESAGASLVVYTDISRDGEFSGVNVEATARMLEATGLRVIASGGVSSLEDIAGLCNMGNARLEGAIIGKALYEDRVDLRAAFEVASAG
jgi:phosphoribosylformimino-5-aminoimidazole carboxamide ribotide isomerase